MESPHRSASLVVATSANVHDSLVSGITKGLMKLPPTIYFGKARQIGSLDNYHLSISHHDKEDEIPKHSHINPYLSLNLGTAYLEKDGASENVVGSGSVILRPSNYEHQNAFEKKSGLCFNIEITSNKNSEILALFERKNIQFSCFEILQILTKTFDNYLDNELDCLITETLLQKLEIKGTDKIPSWYFRVIDKVRDDHTSALSLSSIADCVSLHPNYLARKFKKISGITLGDYIRNTRLEKACLNFNSDKRLTDISLEAGFYDQSHFSNTFRSAFNISPRRFRSLFSG